nr:haloalkane dehalogenase [Actinacidiphila bryophytorum]
MPMPAVDVLDSSMAYREAGTGAPFVFLHGNPTSSHLWRNVLPGVAERARCLAPDLIGMGDSGKPDSGYRFTDHARYLDAWFDALDLHDVVLVGHDWGGALAFDWAARHPGRTRGVAFLETIMRPMSWSEFPASAQQIFRAFRTPGAGEQLVLEENVFIEQALPAGVAGGLSDADLAAYRRPYPTPESRRPLLEWPRAMPLDGEPADVVARIEEYGRWLAATPEVPKLLLAFDPGPGIMIAGPVLEWCRTAVAALEVAECGPAGHHAPEDQPDRIAAALASWADRHGLRTPTAAGR